MRFGRTLQVAGAIALLCRLASADDWPQAQHDPARSGYTAETLTPPFKLLWEADYTPEIVAHRVQPIIYAGKVFVGTKQGSLYAHDAVTGDVRWTFKAGGAILHSMACTDGKAIFGCEDGKVYAVDCETGTLAWSRQTDYPFLTTPLIADNAAYLTNIGGQVFALKPGDGAVIWRVDLGAPAYHSAAYNNGRIYLGADDMRVRCFDARTGTKVWESAKLIGVTLKDYFPLVHKGYVIVRPMVTLDPAPIYWGGRSKWGGWNGGPEEELAQVRAGKMPQRLIDAQQKTVEYFQKHPHDRDCYILDEKTGQEAYIAPLYLTNVMDGCVPPPAVDADGLLIVPVEYKEDRWGRFDLEKRQVVQILMPLAGGKHEPPSGNPDESLAISCAGPLVWIMHIEEGNAHDTGVFDLKTRTYFDLKDSRARAKAKLIRIHPEAPEQWQLPISHNNEVAAHAAAIANGRFYHIVHTYGGGASRLGAWGGKEVAQ